MEDSDEDPSSLPHRPPPSRPSRLAIIDASSSHPSYSDPHSSSQAWHVSHPLISGRSSCASTDNEELESVREVLRQRRLSRQSMLINHVSPGDTYAGIKVKRNNSRYTRAAFTGWRLYVDKKVGQKTMLNHAKILLMQGLSSRAFKSWCLYLLRKRKYRRFLMSIEKILHRHLLQRLWKAWVGFVRQRVQKDEDRRKEKRLLKDMNEKLKERLGRRAEVIMHRKRLEKLFFAFIIQEQRRTLKLQDYVAIIEKENERSKLECGRLSQIVESGEWGRQQYAEILEAKDVLTGEREALTALIGRLNQQQAAVLEQKERNDNEMRHFKDQLFGNNFIHNNKMLIKGASSFNTVVRALKVDALKRGVHPEFLFALDRLAMDKVSVFPDGEIRVKTFCNFEKGKWMPKATSSCIPDLSASCNASSLVNKAQSSQTSP